MSFLWFYTMVIIVASLHHTYGQEKPNYICGGDDDQDAKSVCECKMTVCYFKLSIEHFQVRNSSRCLVNNSCKAFSS